MGKQIQSSDEWPCLEKGQKVEYYLGKKLNPKDPKKASFAARVTLPGGEQCNIADTRNFPARHQRFVGVVEFFDARKGFGFIKPKEDFAFEETDFLASKKGNIYVCREDIKVADGVEVSPSLKDKAEVEFALYKIEDEDKKTKWAAGDVTNVGGEGLGTDDFKPRKAFDPNRKRQNRKRKRNQNQKGKGKKGKKGRNQKFNTGFQMGGKTFVPMSMMNNQPQVVMMNGQAYMVMPQMGGMQMGGMQMAGFGGMKQRKNKRRRKNKNKKNSN